MYLTLLGVWTACPKTLCLAKKVNYVGITFIHWSQSCLFLYLSMVSWSCYYFNSYCKSKYIIDGNFFVISHICVFKMYRHFFMSAHFKSLCHILDMYCFKNFFKVFGLIKNQAHLKILSIVNGNHIISRFIFLFTSYHHFRDLCLFSDHQFIKNCDANNAGKFVAQALFSIGSWILILLFWGALSLEQIDLSHLWYIADKSLASHILDCLVETISKLVYWWLEYVAWLLLLNLYLAIGLQFTIKILSSILHFHID